MIPFRALQSGGAAPRSWLLLLALLCVCILMSGATPHLSYQRPGQKGKNWCAYIVNKNVSCTVIDGTESFIQPQYRCAWNQIHCQPTMVYKVSFRPRYTTSYKVVTELEWRCCPGYKGVDCKEGPSEEAKSVPLQTSRPALGRKDIGTGVKPQKPQEAKKELQDLQNLNEAQEKKINFLEDEMLRLTQTVIDMQTSLAGVNENLKLTIQEDVSKNLVSWLSNLPQPESFSGGKTETIKFQGFSGSTEREDGVRDIISELNGVKEALQSKSLLIDQLNEKLNVYEERLRQFQEASHGPAPTLHTGNAPEKSIDDKLEALRNEMLEGMDIKMADLKNSCDYKLTSVQQQCEDHETSCLGVIELLREKETELRKEINAVKSQGGIQGNGQNCCTNNGDLDNKLKHLDQKVERISEAHKVLNSRIDNEIQHINNLSPDSSYEERLTELDFKINITEKNAEEHCFYIEETLRGLIITNSNEMKDLLDTRLQKMEDIVWDITNASSPDVVHSNTGSTAHHEPESVSGHLVIEMKDLRDAVNQLEGQMYSMLHSSEDYSNNNDGHKENNFILLKSLNDTINEKFDLIQLNKVGIETVSSDLRKLQHKLISNEEDLNLLKDGVSVFNNQILDIKSTVKYTETGLHKKVEEVERLCKDTSHSATNNECCSGLQSRFELLSSEMTADKGKCTEHTQGIQKEMSNVDTRLAKLENVCGKLDTISDSMQRIKDGLNKHVTSLWNCIHTINGTVKSHSNDIYGLKNSVQVFHSQVSKITSDLDNLIKSQPAVGEEPEQTLQTRIIPPLPPREPQKPFFPQVPQQPIIPQQPVIPQIPQYPTQPKVTEHAAQPKLPQDPSVSKPQQQPSQPRQPSLPDSVFTIPVRPGTNGIIVETGEAGPPGRMIKTESRRPQGANGQETILLATDSAAKILKSGSERPHGADGQQAMPVSKGFAGAPGYPQKNVNARDQTKRPGGSASQDVFNIPTFSDAQENLRVSFSESQGATTTTALISFSVGLNGNGMDTFDVGVIHFNNILVNDGEHYNPATGIFTAPIEGRYMITAVLTPEQEHHIEAILSVSNVSVAQMDTSGYKKEVLEYNKPGRLICGGVGTFHLILHLQSGDEVSIVQIGGKIASSKTDEMYSTFSGVFLYPYSSSYR
ncbi:elastin microfibril interfacer 2 L homeolog isoform X2 [Xenopus laevis]|uniref:Elastin microfibril interfacer 2 L homeolog isoform X2 n=1 Tax=Xenopus laevis TaxID=8355 RepID=A0A8J0VHS6_XENLA|nr:elastin microfibril interfacer 2 L homeolog isoform X2 [Xenopus laevis]